MKAISDNQSWLAIMFFLRYPVKINITNIAALEKIFIKIPTTNEMIIKS